MLYNSIEFTVENAVATLAIQRPSVKNAIDITVLRDLNSALDKIQKRDLGVRAVIITGGSGVFCSGLDLHSIDLVTVHARQRGHLEMRRFMDRLILRLSSFRCPIVAAVNGPAVGAGMSLALSSDIIVAGESAYFLPSFARLGLVPDAGITFQLARRIGAGRALASLMLADKIDAASALAWGMIYAVVQDDEVLNRAHAIANRLTSGPSGVIAQLRWLHASTFERPLSQQLRAERLASQTSLESNACSEGVRAFFEKREPNFDP